MKKIFSMCVISIKSLTGLVMCLVWSRLANKSAAVLKNVWSTNVKVNLLVCLKFPKLTKESGKINIEVRDELIRSDNIQVSRKDLYAFLGRFCHSGNIFVSRYLYM